MVDEPIGRDSGTQEPRFEFEIQSARHRVDHGGVDPLQDRQLVVSDQEIGCKDIFLCLSVTHIFGLP